jgi:hypothetical protein
MAELTNWRIMLMLGMIDVGEDAAHKCMWTIFNAFAMHNLHIIMQILKPVVGSKRLFEWLCGVERKITAQILRSCLSENESVLEYISKPHLRFLNVVLRKKWV